ncbi:hypothetical protein [Methylopila turkensis]|uniref:Alpha/beta hydrolase n=1 Tax=Methylopila turkensis TaxID=1437816 RepID=A0A9W6JS69_9HYPH|nr:hypothetical protein [Methylopila turkensis]GLK81329.1 hypothetical protein GCM10008174_30700 [Methylopila turkensis]
MRQDETTGAIGGGDAFGPAREVGAGADGQEVRRRRVLYVAGYMPQSPEQQQMLLRLDVRRFARLWDARVDVGREVTHHPETPSASWPITLTGEGVHVDVTYETLRWDDIVARDFAQPLALKLFYGAGTILEGIFSGLIPRVSRAAPRYALAWAYPVVVVCLAVALAALKGVAVASLFVALDVAYEIGLAVGVGAFALGAVGLLHLLRRSGSFVVHLMDDGRSQLRYARRAERTLHKRVDAFADRIRALVALNDADEILVVGHSSGSFLAIDALARAFEADPEVGRKGPRLALLTAGATELLVALHPAAGWLRTRIARLAVEPSLFWGEVAAPWDALNFPHRDPVTELKLDVPRDRPNPVFRRVYLSKMKTEETIRDLRRGFRLFRLHHQFVMANEIRGPYDYFSLLLGAWSARSQFARTEDRSLMSPLPGAAPPPLPRPAFLKPLPEPGAPERRSAWRKLWSRG